MQNPHNRRRDELLALLPRFKERTTRAEQARQIPRETIEELRLAGLFRTWTPCRFGGDELRLRPTLDLLMKVSRACASTAWVGGLLAMHNLLIGHFSDRAQREVWRDSPDTLVGSSFAPIGRARRVGGGFVLNGRWPFSSGIDHCSWTIPGALIHDDDEPPKGYFFLVPRSDYTICDDWHVAGMRATGSKSFVIEEAFVPEHRAEQPANIGTPQARGREVNTGALYRYPFGPVFTYIFSPVLIGAALEAHALYRENVAVRIGAYTGMEFKDKPSALARLALAAGEIDCARTILRRDFDEMEGLTRAGELVRRDLADRMEFDAAYTVELCSRAVDRIFRASGGKALYQDNPLQRIFRDVHAMRQHAAIDIDDHCERYGRSLIERA